MAERRVARQEHFITRNSRELFDLVHKISLPVSALRHEKSDVLNQAVHILAKLEISTEVFMKGFAIERLLILLSVADEYLSTKNISERKALLELIKQFAINKAESGKIISISPFIQRFSRMPIPEGESTELRDGLLREKTRMAQFDPEKEYIQPVNSLPPESLLSNSRENIQILPKQSEELTRALNNSPSPLIDIEVQRLSEIMEKPFVFGPIKVEVLDMSVAEFKKYFGGVGFWNQPNIIIVPKDYGEDTIRHEFIHIQSAFNGFGVMTISSIKKPHLFFYLNEGLTENLTRKPRHYKAERRVIQKLIQQNPAIENMLYKAYLDFRYRRQLYDMLITQVGLKGFLALARMNSSFEENYYMGPLEKKIMISCEQAYNLL
ncbi:MAG: hypothetical protein HYV32_01135 [Candidatus Kerfeldbacteria bacterium]|nr:hypothetical protein [Candidatus Kerfeldbacteria bacterium]